MPAPHVACALSQYAPSDPIGMAIAIRPARFVVRPPALGGKFGTCEVRVTALLVVHFLVDIDSVLVVFDSTLSEDLLVNDEASELVLVVS